jgi:hypothetical protein
LLVIRALELQGRSVLHKKLEYYGLILVLLSSFVQFFILNKSQELTSGAVVYKIETKMDVMFSAIRSNYQSLNADSKEKFWVNPDHFNNYKYAEMNQSMEKTKSQTEWLGNIVAFFFLLGSVLMVLGKKIELSNSNKSLKQDK